MDNARFWRAIDSARKQSGGEIDDYAAALEKQLRQLHPDDLIEFEELFDRKIDDAYRWPLWGAAYLINGGCSDDGFLYFRGWLVMQGQAVYEKALADPDFLAAVIEDDVDAECEEVLYVARSIYQETTGSSMPLKGSGGSPSPEPVGQPWQEEDLPSLFPRIEAKTSG
jgi:hypothetical protein